MDYEAVELAGELVAGARRIAVITGAGISRPSGIPDFRSISGLWSSVDPVEVASLRAFRRDPARFYSWLNSLIDPMIAARANPAHQALAAMEHAECQVSVITQNIDGLHQQAGSQRVFELHGHLRTVTCETCGRQAPIAPFMPQIQRGQPPYCDCGGVFKPDVVLFDEMLPQGLVWLAHKTLQECDLLIVAGTSLEVAPVCDLPLLAVRRGVPVIIVNLEPTYLDRHARVVLHEDVAVALPAIVEARQSRRVNYALAG